MDKGREKREREEGEKEERKRGREKERERERERENYRNISLIEEDINFSPTYIHTCMSMRSIMIVYSLEGGREQNIFDQLGGKKEGGCINYFQLTWSHQHSPKLGS